MKRIYLAGPMSALPNLNFPAFYMAAATLRLLGYAVFNPAEQGADAPVELHYATYLPADIRALLDSEAVVVLPGWEQSRGALLEVLIATALGLPVYPYAELDMIAGGLEPALSLEFRRDGAALTPFPARSETILEEAQRICGGDRHAGKGTYDATIDRPAG